KGVIVAPQHKIASDHQEHASATNDRLGDHSHPPCRRIGYRQMWLPFSRSQLLVGDPLPGYRINETVQPFERVSRDVTSIQPKSELIDVSTQVLRTRVVVDTMQSAFQNRPNTLNAVGMNRASFVLTCTVVYR